METYYDRASQIYVNPDLEGYLMEKKMMRNTKTWCSIQGPTLYFQKAQTNQGVIQTINMPSEVQLVRKLSDTSQFEIVLKKGKHIIFICQTPAECLEWVKALLTAMALQSNGVGLAQFHTSSEPLDENLYTLPIEDIAAVKSPEPSESLYEQVQPTRVGENIPCHTVSQQPPALPSMESRRQQQQAVIAVDNSQHAQTKEDEGEEYTDAFSIQADKELHIDGLSQKAGKPTQNFTNADCQHSVNSIPQLQPRPVDIRSEEPQKVEIRSKVTINVTDDADPSPESSDETDGIEADSEVNVFAELDQALVCQDMTGLHLEHPLVTEDFLPLDQLQEFMAQNEQILYGTSHYPSSILSQVEDPVADLKIFLKSLKL